MIRVVLADPTPSSPDPTPPSTSPPHHIWEDLHALLHELDWFVTRDWQYIVRDPHVATVLIRQATRAALLAEDIRTDISHTTATHTHGQTNETLRETIRHYLSPSTEPQRRDDDPPHITEIPITVDRVILYEFGHPKEHEHPLYVNHHIVSFCAAFYHEDEFIFARAHLQLLLTPAHILNWLAGSRSVPVDQNHFPLTYVPDGNLFHLLGMGITQLIYLNQTELMMKMKQGLRFPADYKLNGPVMPAGLNMPQPVLKSGDRQQPAWVNIKS